VMDCDLAAIDLSRPTYGTLRRQDTADTARVRQTVRK
jgi:hypothetical protein